MLGGSPKVDISGPNTSVNNTEKGDINIYQSPGSRRLQDFPLENFASLLEHVARGALHISREVSNGLKYHPGTRVAILDDVYHWAAASEYITSIRWIYGNAGSGKSTLLRTLAKILEHHSLVLASFFFLREGDRQNNTDYFIPTIVYQIARSIPSTRSHIERAIKDDPWILAQSLEAQAQALIVNPIIQAHQENDIGQQCRRIIIIDGLDQCEGKQEQQEVLQVLNAILQEVPITLAFLVASRPEPHILSILDSDLSKSSTRLALEAFDEDGEGIRNDQNLCQKCKHHSVRPQPTDHIEKAPSEPTEPAAVIRKPREQLESESEVAPHPPPPAPLPVFQAHPAPPVAQMAGLSVSKAGPFPSSYVEIIQQPEVHAERPNVEGPASPPLSPPLAPLVPASAMGVAPSTLSKAPTPPTADAGITATALYDYEAAAEDDITFREDDIITEIKFAYKDWWEGKNCDGDIGLFPSNYVDLRVQQAKVDEGPKIEGLASLPPLPCPPLLSPPPPGFEPTSPFSSSGSSSPFASSSGFGDASSFTSSSGFGDDPLFAPSGFGHASSFTSSSGFRDAPPFTSSSGSGHASPFTSSSGFTSASPSTLPLAFLAASRPEPHISAIFDSDLSKSSARLALAGSDEVSEDIRNDQKIYEKRKRHPVRLRPTAHVGKALPEPIKHAAATRKFCGQLGPEPEVAPPPLVLRAQRALPMAQMAALSVAPEPEPESEPVVSHGQGIVALVTMAYEATTDYEINLLEGEYIERIEKIDEGSWLGVGPGGKGAFSLESEVHGGPTSPIPREPTLPNVDAGITAVALYDFDAAGENEITFREYDTITEIEFAFVDWWEGKNPGGNVGLFPATYVHLWN